MLGRGYFTMRFILQDDFNKFFKEEDIIAEKITFMQEDIYQLVHETEVTDKTSLLDFLNSLCNLPEIFIFFHHF